VGLIDDSQNLLDAGFTDPEFFGEQVTFTGLKTGGSRTVYATVTRNPPKNLGAGVELRGDDIVVYVRNHATQGLLESEIDTGATMCTLPVRKGATPQARSVVNILNQDGGMWSLRVT
jgi:hypothetical protein